MPIQQITSTDIANLPTSSVGATQLATGSVEGYLNTQGSAFGFRNRIINGAMVIDQRNAGNSVSSPSGYIVDRWVVESSNSSTTAQQVSDAPPGFAKSLKFTSTTGGTISSGSYCDVTQKIEGYNIYDLNFGLPSASSFTVSFWVKSSITGIFALTLRMDGANIGYFTTYTINNPNTWQYVTVTVPGNTATAFASTTNGIGLSVGFLLGAGSTYISSTANTWTTGGSNGYGQINTATGSNSVFTTTGATWQVTGVQLEKGSVATPFEYRDYGRELQMCQRYYWKTQTTYFPGKANGTTQWYGSICCPVSMRTTPTPSLGAGTSYCFVYNGNTGLASTTGTSFTVSSISDNYIFMQVYHDGFSGLTDNSIVTYRNGGNLAFSAEL